MICLVLICTFIQIGNTQPTFLDDDVDNQIENAFSNNYDSPMNDKTPFEDMYYHRKQSSPDNVQLDKRIIMLPRVGRRSVRST
jgi:hypothetical protein